MRAFAFHFCEASVADAHGVKAQARFGALPAVKHVTESYKTTCTLAKDVPAESTMVSPFPGTRDSTAVTHVKRQLPNAEFDSAILTVRALPMKEHEMKV